MIQMLCICGDIGWGKHTSTGTFSISDLHLADNFRWPMKYVLIRGQCSDFFFLNNSSFSCISR